MNPQRRRLLAATAGTVVAGVALSARVLAQPAEQVIRITARKFVFLPRQITLKKGVPVVRTGTFEFLCDIFCGDGHEGMHGTIEVVA